MPVSPYSTKLAEMMGVRGVGGRSVLQEFVEHDSRRVKCRFNSTQEDTAVDENVGWVVVCV